MEDIKRRHTPIKLAGADKVKIKIMYSPQIMRGNIRLDWLMYLCQMTKAFITYSKGWKDWKVREERVSPPSCSWERIPHLPSSLLWIRFKVLVVLQMEPKRKILSKCKWVLRRKFPLSKRSPKTNKATSLMIIPRSALKKISSKITELIDLALRHLWFWLKRCLRKQVDSKRSRLHSLPLEKAISPLLTTILN